MQKPWEHMSRDEKLDYIKEQIEATNASLATLVKHYAEISEHLGTLAKIRN